MNKNYAIDGRIDGAIDIVIGTGSEDLLVFEPCLFRLRLKNFPRSVSSSIFCMDLLSAFNNARFKFQGSGSNILVMIICLNHIKLKEFQENL